MIDRAEITSILYQRNKTMLSADRNKDFVAAMYAAGTLMHHYHALSCEYQRLAAEALQAAKLPQDTTQD